MKSSWLFRLLCFPKTRLKVHSYNTGAYRTSLHSRKAFQILQDGASSRINLCYSLLTKNDQLSSSALDCMHICFNGAVQLGGYVSRSGNFQHKITGVNGKVSPHPWIESARLSAWGRGPIISPNQFSRLGRLYRKLWIAPGAPRSEWAIPDFNVSKLSPPSKGVRAWYHSALCAYHFKYAKKYHARSTTQPCMTLSCILEMSLSLASLATTSKNGHTPFKRTPVWWLTSWDPEDF